MVFSAECLFRIASSLLVFLSPGNLHQHDYGVLERQIPTAVVASSPATSSASRLTEGISTWIISSAGQPPSASDISKLQRAFAQFYGVDRDLVTSEQMLTEVIEIWKDQPLDEQAGLYRVRADCYMLLGLPEKALQDYNKAVTFLETEDAAAAADPNELPIAILGRARASKTLAVTSKSNSPASSENYAKMAAIDYRRYLIATSREEWDTEVENIADGATRNPFAAWEWSDALRLSMGSKTSGKELESSAEAFTIASTAFREIGDQSRSVISALDAAIQYAASVSDDKASSEASNAERLLKTAIASTKGVESRDVSLLQRVIIKEGEAGVALAALLWNDNQRPEAEQVLGNTCLRLEQLQQKIIESQKMIKKTEKGSTMEPAPKLLYSIDDDERNIGQLDCGQFRNPAFVRDTLGWPPSLQEKVRKLQTLR